ncbi:hypothetical protein ACFU6R_09080 [Streptomyces sp. NPDC057499]|uniref:hypothetical protein n=1 Tax=Streptomyces sp. NPDC057499 TaxID=3346150 RepID=UPI0036905513
MRRRILGSNGRRGTLIAASAAVLCLGGVLAACGGATGEGHAALGAAGTDPGAAAAGAGDSPGKVTMVPLDPGGGSRGAGGSGDGGGDRRGPSGGATGDASLSPSGTPGRGTGTAPGPATGPSAPSTPSGSSAPSGPSKPSGPGTPSAPSSPSDPGTPSGPAVLSVGTPVREAADERWCEKVTVEFRNTGGSPARSGTVTFATHVIGSLGVDWATVESTGPLPAPIDAGAARTATYTVCVDAWRVPLGMHVETRDVTAVSK